MLNVSLDTVVPDANLAAWIQMSAHQKDAALLPLAHGATDCIVWKVSADPRYSAEMRPDAFNDLIVGSIVGCTRQVRAMIDAHDRVYGYVSTGAFVLDPYLDVLPAAVVRQVRIRAPSRPPMPAAVPA